MKHIVIYILFFVVNSFFCFGQQSFTDEELFKKVSFSLKNNDKSFESFNLLYQTYSLDLKIRDKSYECYFDLYAHLYNKGIPIVRLIKKDTLEKAFEQLIEKGDFHRKSSVYRKYKEIITNINNYNTDYDIGERGEQKKYFQKFLNDYFILPETK